MSRDEVLLHEARVALTFYARWMAAQSENTLTYPYGQDVERRLRARVESAAALPAFGAGDYSTDGAA